MGLAGARARGPERRWRLTFDVDGHIVQTVAIGRDRRDVDDAVLAFRAAVRNAMEKGGCRSFCIGVHVEGEACDHEV